MSNPDDELATTKQQFIERINVLDDYISLEELTEILGSTVKHDNQNKAITFLSMLLTYSDSDQINLAFLAESSSGKSYIPLELAWYFPKTDVLEYGYVSPTGFYHEYGEYDAETHIIKIDLSRKILIFLDQPSDELLKRMRPILSHDRKTVTMKITDRREKSGMRTKTIELKGYATHIYCSVKYNLGDQEKTRQLLLSPEITQEKIREAVWLRLKKEGNRAAYDKHITDNFPRRKLATRVEDIKKANIDYIDIPEELITQIGTRFLEKHTHLQARQTRDITRLLAIIKGFALLNFKKHKREVNTITVEAADVEVGFQLYSVISEANELGLPPELYKVYSDLKPKMDEYNELGFTRRDFQRLYYQTYQKILGRKVEDILKTLVDVGLLQEEQDPANKRQNRYNTRDLGTTQSNSHPSETTTILTNTMNLQSEEKAYSPLACYIDYGKPGDFHQE